MNQQDIIREAILKTFYQRYKNTHVRPRAGVHNIRVFHGEIGDFSENEIFQNFEYLVQTGWIKKERVEKQDFFIISDKGINHFEGPSNFQKSHWATGINIANASGVVVVGNNNFVQQDYQELYNGLDLLLEEVRKNQALTDEQKISYQADIETIKNQLAKPNPSKTIISNAWSALSVLGGIEGFIQFIERVKHLIGIILK